MKRPYLKGDAFLQDVADSRASGRLNLWWLGQSGFLVQYGDAHLLFDPYLSDSLTKKYTGTNKPHVRMTELVIAPERLDFIDVLTSTHNHTDHLDHETVIPLLSANPELNVIVPRANLDFAADRFNVPTKRLTPISVTEQLEIGAFTFRAVPAAHERVETDSAGHHKFIGYIVEVGDYTIYHSGDTILYDGMVELLTSQIDVAILPINGRDPARGVAGNLTAGEAVHLAKAIGASLVIPCHFDMFEFNTVPPQDFVTLAEQANQPYTLLRNGERLTLNW